MIYQVCLAATTSLLVCFSFPPLTWLAHNNRRSRNNIHLHIKQNYCYVHAFFVCLTPYHFFSPASSLIDI